MENRKHERTQFFLVPSGRELVPVWVFKAPDDQDAHAGVILDMSEGGFRVTTDAKQPLRSSRYRMKLRPDPDAESANGLQCTVRRVWSEEDGKLNLVSGMQFEDSSAAAACYLAAQAPTSADRSWVRCTLHELES